ncbi:MAG: hypothetical protein ACTTKB_01415 [Treponema sp.]
MKQHGPTKEHNSFCRTRRTDKLGFTDKIGLPSAPSLPQANLHKLSGGAADSLQDTFSAKEQSTVFRQSKTPKPMQVLRAVALSRAGRREWVSGKGGQKKLGFTDITWFTVRLQFC